MMITFSGTVETLAAGRRVGRDGDASTSCANEARTGERRGDPVRRAILVFISVPSRWLGPHQRERTLRISPTQAGDASGGPVCRIHAMEWSGVGPRGNSGEAAALGDVDLHQLAVVHGQLDHPEAKRSSASATTRRCSGSSA
jgi:hypothetical protein